MDLNDDHISGFILKTYELVDQGNNLNIIKWNDSGDGFLILLPHEFARDILPSKFKHNNIASFTRQLNFYGFNKFTKDNIISEYKHVNFIRGRKDLLTLIKRKKSVSKNKLDEHHNDMLTNLGTIPNTFNPNLFLMNGSTITAPAATFDNTTSNINSENITLVELAREVRTLKRQYDEMWAMQSQFMIMFTSLMRGRNGTQTMNMSEMMNNFNKKNEWEPNKKTKPNTDKVPKKSSSRIDEDDGFLSSDDSPRPLRKNGVEIYSPLFPTNHSLYPTSLPSFQHNTSQMVLFQPNAAAALNAPHSSISFSINSTSPAIQTNAAPSGRLTPIGTPKLPFIPSSPFLNPYHHDFSHIPSSPYGDLLDSRMLAPNELLGTQINSSTPSMPLPTSNFTRYDSTQR